MQGPLQSAGTAMFNMPNQEMAKTYLVYSVDRRLVKASWQKTLYLGGKYIIKDSPKPIQKN